MIRKIYGNDLVWERHRHRYEVSNRYRNQLNEGGLLITGVTADDALVESVGWADNPWGIGVQFHPEFQSRPTKAHPLFRSFIEASVEMLRRSGRDTGPDGCADDVRPGARRPPRTVTQDARAENDEHISRATGVQ
jgi:CTP synthase